MTSQQPILLIGGNGKTGSRVAKRLEALGRPFRIGSRSARPAFDWQDRDTWAAAMDGACAAYITYYPDVTVPGGVEAVEGFVQLALRKGVRRLVFLSGRGEEAAQRAEQALIRSGAAWTVVRAAWFMENFSEGFFLDGILAGEMVFPADGVTEPFVAADDIADVVTAALCEDGHAGRIYDVTGPRLITFAQAVGEIASTIGRDIRYRPVSVEAYVAALREADVPDDYVALMEYLTRDVLDGRNQTLSDGVRQALGRAPRDFADYARETASIGIWRN